MRLASLLYVSRSLIEGDVDNVVHSIIERARCQNAAVQITGAMLFTGSRFAQILEGPAAAVLELIGQIVADERHTDILLVQVKSLESRVFSKWSMAYAGPSVFVQRNVNRAMVPPPGASKPDPLPLIRLLTEFSTQH